MKPILPSKREVPAHELFRTLASLLESDASRRDRHAIAVLDVDALTAINLVHGRLAGDVVLALVVDALALSLSGEERAAWWAGDQYVILFPGAGRRVALGRTMEIVARIAARADAHHARVSACAGVASYPEDGSSNAVLVEAAAAALRRAKHQGRGRVCAEARRSAIEG